MIISLLENYKLLFRVSMKSSRLVDLIFGASTVEKLVALAFVYLVQMVRSLAEELWDSLRLLVQFRYLSSCLTV